MSVKSRQEADRGRRESGPRAPAHSVSPQRRDQERLGQKPKEAPPDARLKPQGHAAGGSEPRLTRCWPDGALGKQGSFWGSPPPAEWSYEDSIGQGCGADELSQAGVTAGAGRTAGSPGARRPDIYHYGFGCLRKIPPGPSGLCSSQSQR